MKRNDNDVSQVGGMWHVLPTQVVSPWLVVTIKREHKVVKLSVIAYTFMQKKNTKSQKHRKPQRETRRTTNALISNWTEKKDTTLLI